MKRQQKQDNAAERGQFSAKRKKDAVLRLLRGYALFGHRQANFKSTGVAEFRGDDMLIAIFNKDPRRMRTSPNR
ncbi:hypothetical protein JKA73_02435 [Myxococcus xanthus]|uniref:hypothetical protein n=1 Tax=Myxococcus xanthus TaxID=34 RepID=UPI0019171F86|nr:hypothetical protein [Myxococcus xanthus]QQR45024.1 hypothetical protein JKA73_02435 [Myxococcus xanthus]